ncbi:MAG: 50S ribosomal protein L25/general stress protein Ctc [Gammaproteobacteria bacterium]|nr:50S ribosomal protein L25/general stress protein Ctc [Gammaproteobacteria bacterium]
MNEFEVVAQPRTALGTNASRRLRRTGMIPAILYGGGKDPVPLSLEENRIRKQIENEAFAAHILTVKVEDEESQAVLKSVHRDPATERVLHMDFQRISASSEIHMHVPLHFINEEDCPGRRAGGIVTHLLVEIEVGCLPKDLPEYLEVDMASLDVGDSVHLSELVLPEGVHVMALAHNPDNDQPVVSVQHPQKLEVEPVAEEDELEVMEAPAATEPEAEED